MASLSSRRAQAGPGPAPERLCGGLLAPGRDGQRVPGRAGLWGEAGPPSARGLRLPPRRTAKAEPGSLRSYGQNLGSDRAPGPRLCCPLPSWLARRGGRASWSPLLPRGGAPLLLTAWGLPLSQPARGSGPCWAPRCLRTGPFLTALGPVTGSVQPLLGAAANTVPGK